MTALAFHKVGTYLRLISSGQPRDCTGSSRKRKSDDVDISPDDVCATVPQPGKVETAHVGWSCAVVEQYRSINQESHQMSFDELMRYRASPEGR